ncbi:uncharacterized protein [Montipora foliosa]|uniref:uncharacterized protein n=1 Tax=Montipora foliosa TaxID=591990 RepID=UPI0035F14299
MMLEEKRAEHEMSKPQAVKLQEYTITPFKGDCKDWVRFWNQFVVEVDSSKISEISKFNYLLELVHGEPKNCILCLPHTAEGYLEAKNILEMTFGKDIKVHKALFKDLESLPNITSVSRIKDIHAFHSQLSTTVRTLATMKKLQGAQSYVYNIMDKLGPVREAMAQKDDNWEEWGLEELVENLRKYTDRNPLPDTHTPSNEVKKPVANQGSHQRRGDKLLMSGSTSRQLRQQQMPACVSSSHSHRSSECTKVLDVASRRKFLKSNRLCFNCARSGHAPAQCRSRGCGKCNSRHQTSICDRLNTTLPGNTPSTSLGPSDRFYVANDCQTTLHSTVVAKVNGVRAQIMLDSGASSSYISANLLTELNIKPYRIDRRVIEQMYGTVDKQVEIYNVHLKSNTIDDFEMELQCINAEKPVLTYLPNPRVPELKLKNSRIRRLVFSEEAATAEKLPVHVTNYLGTLNIKWKFNLARAPLWGGFFERLVGIMKRSLSKVVGRRFLSYSELEQVLLDVETSMNNRPLLYQGEEFEQPVLTPNTLLRGKLTPILEQDLEKIGEEDVTKRMRFLQKSKEQLRKRFMKEYIHALDEKQHWSTGNIDKTPNIGAVVLLKGDTKDKALWKLGRVGSKISGKDGIVRGLKLKQGNGYVVERPLQPRGRRRRSTLETQPRRRTVRPKSTTKQSVQTDC